MRRFLVAGVIALAVQVAFVGLGYVESGSTLVGRAVLVVYYPVMLALEPLVTRRFGHDNLGYLLLGTMVVGPVVYSVLMGLLMACLRKRPRRYANPSAGIARQARDS
jgi:hypothetical protein